MDASVLRVAGGVRPGGLLTTQSVMLKIESAAPRAGHRPGEVGGARETALRRFSAVPVDLNHTILRTRNNWESAAFLAGVLGLTVGPPWGPFVPVATSNGVTLDFVTVPVESIIPQHYAFLVSEEEFDAAFDRILRAGTPYFAEPHGEKPKEINHHHGGRGLYFPDPSGHGMEIITRPYASHVASTSWR